LAAPPPHDGATEISAAISTIDGFTARHGALEFRDDILALTEWRDIGVRFMPLHSRFTTYRLAYFISIIIRVMGLDADFIYYTSPSRSRYHA
jgi:hypothetical protein